MTPPEKVELPSVNDRVEIEFVLRKAAPIEHHMLTIQEETEEGWVVTPPPEEEISLRPGSALVGRFTRGGNAWEFDSICLAAAAGALPLLYILKPLPRDVRKRQLRSFARVDCEIPVQIVRHDHNEDAEPVSGMIRNLSGGGALLECLTEVQPGDMLRLRFTLPGRSDALSGIIAKMIKEVPGEASGVLRVLQFEGIDEGTRSEIIRYTFEIQRKIRRKGKRS